jgi:hypothetical protein
VDGIERIPDVPASPGVVPFRVTGLQFPKHTVLFQQLIPGNAYAFPNESLSAQELVRTLAQVGIAMVLNQLILPLSRPHSDKIKNTILF